MIKLAQRNFHLNDQQRFASASGDYNPMHLDPLQARRTQAGAPLVHGIHLLLWALDSLAAVQPDLPPLCALRVHFTKFVYLGESVQVVLAQQGPNGAKLMLSVDDAPRSKVSLTFGVSTQVCPAWSVSSLKTVPFAKQSSNLDFSNIENLSGRVAFVMTPADAVGMFPAASKWIGAKGIASLAATTHLIGMICPGLHSIYSELSIQTCSSSGPQDSLAFRVTEVDKRFRSVEQEIGGGGLMGTVQSFARTPPVEQATMKSLMGIVNPQEFAGSLALVVGGSRGLGELIAKLIAAGGGRVIVTWQSGKDDAERVAEEIRAAGGECATLAYDACNSADEQLASLTETPTHAYYLATPPIFRPQAEIFAPLRFKEFLAFYVEGFWQLTQALRARQPRVSIFYPSSISVAERPEGMTEYTMAKAAGELLCEDINASLAPLHVTTSRLPRLPTDQTASVTPAETAHPLDTMLPIVREVQSWPR